MKMVLIHYDDTHPNNKITYDQDKIFNDYKLNNHDNR